MPASPLPAPPDCPPDTVASLPAGAPDLSATVAVLLAGGRGSRLHELTANECKPALHLGPRFRVVDFAMANAVRSGLSRMVAGTQYCPGTLMRHLAEVWAPAFPEGGLAIRDGRAAPGGEGYAGTADVLRANAALLDGAQAREVVVLAADHVYAMDYRPMIAAHRASGARLTVAAMPVPRAEAGGFGILAAGPGGRIAAFVEKPACPPAMPGAPDMALASLGIYVIDWPWLRELLADPRLADFGMDVIPAAVAMGEAAAWIWEGEGGLRPYWRDVGTLDAFRRAALDFDPGPAPFAPPVTGGSSLRLPPDGMCALGRFGGQIASGGMRLYAPLIRAADRSRWAMLDESVLMPGARVGPGVRLTRAIVAPGTPVPEGLVAGEDPDEDARWFRVTSGGTVLITSAMIARRGAERIRALPFFSRGRRVAAPAPAPAAGRAETASCNRGEGPAR